MTTKIPPRFPRFVLLLIAIAAIACFIATVRNQRVGASAVNGRIAFTSDRITNASFDEHDLAWQPLGATPTPTPTFTVSGTVTDSTGAPLAGVTMVLLSDPRGTQITFTDQNGNYVLNFPQGGSNRLTVTASKANYIFNPLSVIFIFPSGSQTRDFVGIQSPIPLPFCQIPVLLTQENSLHSAALDSVLLTSEAFGIVNSNNFSSDQRGRVSLFATSFDLWPNEPRSVLTAEAEDSLGNVFPLTIEAYSPVPNFPWLKQIVVKLPDEIANKVEVSVSIKARGATSNKVVVKVKP